MSQEWEKVDKLIRKENQSVTDSTSHSKPLEALEKSTLRIQKDRLDLLGRFKAGSIERKAALEQMRSFYETQLEANRHALNRALDVDRQRVDLVAKKYIFSITEEYLRDMREMGLHNFDARLRTLFALNEEAAKLFKEAEAQDVPESMKQKTREAITAKYNDFYRSLIDDEIKLG